jgi:hypothetical protein
MVIRARGRSARKLGLGRSRVKAKCRGRAPAGHASAGDRRRPCGHGSCSPAGRYAPLAASANARHATRGLFAGACARRGPRATVATRRSKSPRLELPGGGVPCRRSRNARDTGPGQMEEVARTMRAQARALGPVLLNVPSGVGAGLAPARLRIRDHGATTPLSSSPGGAPLEMRAQLSHRSAIDSPARVHHRCRAPAGRAFAGELEARAFGRCGSAVARGPRRMQAPAKRPRVAHG